MPRRPRESGLVADAHAAIHFLDGYLHGRRGYTSADARAGVLRLADLCRRIRQAPGCGPREARVLDDAEDCLRQVRERLG